MLDKLKQIKFKIQTLKQTDSNIDKKLSVLSTSLQDLNAELNEILEHRQYYKRAIDIIYERSIQELKDILNSALAFVFNDRNFEIDIILSDKRGKSLSLVIMEDGHVVNLRRAMGMGIKCVVSAVLHIYYLQCKNSKILMLDEAYSAISAEYLPNFFAFIKQLCEKLEFKIVLITHDERFKEYGDKVYSINQGLVQCLLSPI